MHLYDLLRKLIDLFSFFLEFFFFLADSGRMKGSLSQILGFPELIHVVKLFEKLRICLGLILLDNSFEVPQFALEYSCVSSESDDTIFKVRDLLSEVCVFLDRVL